MLNHNGVTRLNGYLSIPETAVRIKKSRYTVYRLIREGQLKAVQTGRGMSVRESDLNRYQRKQAS